SYTQSLTIILADEHPDVEVIGIDRLPNQSILKTGRGLLNTTAMARNASLRARTNSLPPKAVIGLSSPRRNSFSDSLKTKNSDPQD
ncbi:unnamed protein product, partial [Clonostachys solani]